MRKVLLSLCALPPLPPWLTLVLHIKHLIQQFFNHRGAGGKAQRDTEDLEQDVLCTYKIIKMKQIEIWLQHFQKIWESRFNQLDIVLLTIKNKRT